MAPFSKDFRPEEFFLKPTEGAGVVTDILGRSIRRCVITTAGSTDEAFGAIHFDEVYQFDDGVRDEMHWAIARGDSGAFTGSEITVVGRPKVSLAGPTWRIRFKRFGQAPFEGATLTYDARFTQTTDDVVIKRVNISLWGLRLASLVGFHRHAL